MWLIALASAAEPQTRVQDVHDPAHPVALGSRMGMWAGPYESPALGGHIKVKPTKGIGVEGFSDHTLRLSEGIARHDHVLGFSLYTPALVGNDRWFLSPTVGACVDFRVDTPFQQRGPSNTDILFGAHAGAMAEVAAGKGWSVEGNAQLFAYVGNQIATDDWRATASPGLHLSGVLQVIMALNYTL